MKKVMVFLGMMTLSGCKLFGIAGVNEFENIQHQSNVGTAVEKVESEEVGDTTNSGYVPYSSDALTEAMANGGRVVLFFHASWCPTCRAAEADITGRLDEIPEDVTILKVDYDSESELKREYGVVTQHTFVEVDGDGNDVQKWNGGSLDEILERLG